MSTGPRSAALFLGALALVTALAVGVPGARADGLTLYVTYTTSCTFGITDNSGATIGNGAVIPSGSYQIVVQTPFPFAEGDLAQIPPSCDFIGFELTGPGVNVSTDLTRGDSDVEQYSAQLQSGATYTAFDDNQPSVTRKISASSSVAATGSSATSSSSSISSQGPSKTTTTKSSGSGASALGTPLKADPFRGTLSGLVSAAGKLTLTDKGRSVSTLKSGRYTIAVIDQTKKGGFTVQGLRKLPETVTGVGFVGKHSLTVDLTPGQWLFYASPTARKNYFIVIS